MCILVEGNQIDSKHDTVIIVLTHKYSVQVCYSMLMMSCRKVISRYMSKTLPFCPL